MTETVKVPPLVAKTTKPEGTRVSIGNIQIGAEEFVVAAGPCAVESRDQMLEAARGVASGGARLLRGGAFKPRTSPYSFQGLGEEGLRLLRDAGRHTGLATVTEVMTAEDVPLVARYADALQVGARNMQNFSLLKALGSAGKPVLLKRGLSSTIEELLLAAEYICLHGNAYVILCERGIRTFETATRNTLDLNAVALLKQLTHLPVMVDPSHGTGRRDLVGPMARASAVLGADGLIIEVHPHPERALSDGPQSITTRDFGTIMRDLKAYLALQGRTIAVDAGEDCHVTRRRCRISVVVARREVASVRPLRGCVRGRPLGESPVRSRADREYAGRLHSPLLRLAE
jgi:3-deoxy-7-phosphoheptulonate synthase